MILFTIVLQHFSSLLHEETGLEQFLSFAERMVQDSVVEVKILSIAIILYIGYISHASNFRIHTTCPKIKTAKRN